MFCDPPLSPRARGRTRPGPGRRWIATLALLLVGALVASGCGSNPAEQSTPVQQGGAAPGAGAAREVAATLPVGDGLDSTGPTTDGPATNPVPTNTVPTNAVPSPGPGGPDVSCSTVAYTPVFASAPRFGDLCVPPRQRDVAIVLVHGGGGTGGERSHLEPWQQRYLDAGYVTLNIDYTLLAHESADYSGTDAIAGPVFPVPEQNVKAAIQYLRIFAADLEIDPDRIVVAGWSAGARLAGIVATTGDDPFYGGGELWAGVSDAPDGIIAYYGYYTGWNFLNEDYYGAASSAPADAVAAAEDLSGPTLLFHGGTDGLVAPERSEEFAAAIEAADGEVELVIYPEENHAFDGHLDNLLTETGAHSAEVTLGWLQRWFGGTRAAE